MVDLGVDGGDIKIDLQGIRREGVNRVVLAQDRAIVDTVMELVVP